MGMGSGKGKAPVKSVGKEKTAVKAKDKAVGKAAAMQQRMEAMSAAKSKKQGAAAPKETAKPAKTEKIRTFGGNVKVSSEKLQKNKDQMAKFMAASKPAAPAPAMKCGGKVKKYARGGGIEVRGKTKGKLI